MNEESQEHTFEGGGQAIGVRWAELEKKGFRRAVRIPSREYAWKPQKDITSYELALCITPMMASAGAMWGSPVQMIDGLPPEAKRHFEETGED